MKRKARIDGDSMNVEVFQEDELQKVLDQIKNDVEGANNLSEEEYQKKVKIRQELENLKQRQKDATEKLKEDSDGLVF